MIRKTENALLDSILLVLSGFLLLYLLSLFDYHEEKYPITIIIFSSTFTTLIIWKITGFDFLKGDLKLIDIGLYSLFLFTSCYCFFLNANTFQRSYMVVLCILCIIRLSLMHSELNPPNKEGDNDVSLYSLLTSKSDDDAQNLVDIPSEGDLFKTDPFQKYLSSRITNATGSNNNVIGLVGKWGSGKTTIISLAYKHYLEEKCYNLVTFDAWSYMGEETIILGILDSIMNEIPDFSSYNRKYRRRIIELLSKSNNTVVSLTGILFNTFQRDITEELKKDLSKYLTENDLKILVIIENLDRSSDEHKKQIVAALNGILKIRNIVFILTFDTNNLCEELKNNKFLDKIVLEQIFVPKYNSNQYKTVLVSGIKKIVYNKNSANMIVELLDDLLHFLRVPRDIVIILKQAEQINSIENRSLDPQDFFILRYIERTNNDLYEMIVLNQMYVCTHHYNALDLNYKEKRKQFLTSIREKYPDYWGIVSTLTSTSDIDPLLFKYSDDRRPYRYRDGRYCYLYTSWTSLDYEAVDRMVEQTLASNCKNMETTIDDLIKNHPEYNRRHYINRLVESRDYMNDDTKVLCAITLFRRSSEMYENNMSILEFQCCKLLSNLDYRYHQQFLDSVTEQYDKVFNLEHIYYTMEHNKENTEEIRQSYRKKFIEMCKRIIDEQKDLYHDYYQKHNIWCLTDENLNIDIESYLNNILNDNEAIFRFYEDLLVQTYSTSINGTEMTESVNDGYVEKLANKEFIKKLNERIEKTTMKQRESELLSLIEQYLKSEEKNKKVTGA